MTTVDDFRQDAVPNHLIVDIDMDPAVEVSLQDIIAHGGCNGRAPEKAIPEDIDASIAWQLDNLPALGANDAYFQLSVHRSAFKSTCLNNLGPKHDQMTACVFTKCRTL